MCGKHERDGSFCVRERTQKASELPRLAIRFAEPSLLCYDELDSTNDEAKRLLHAARQGDDSIKGTVPVIGPIKGTVPVIGPIKGTVPVIEEGVTGLYGVVVTASRQSAGRGRNGKPFASPGGDSIYATFILRPPEDPAEQRITAFAAVAVCHAIEKTTSYKPGIKWINDIYLDGKKICGILAESVPGAVILGVGININLDKKDLPDELKKSAGSLKLSAEERALLFECLREEVFRCMDIDRPDTEEASALMDEYRARSVVIGKPVLLLLETDISLNPCYCIPAMNTQSHDGYFRVPAYCEGIADDGALIVRHTDGSLEELRSGGVTVQPV